MSMTNDNRSATPSTNRHPRAGHGHEHRAKPSKSSSPARSSQQATKRDD